MAQLAINGASPLREAPYPAWTVTTEKDYERLSRTFDSRTWGPGGPQNRAFRAAFEAYSGSKHCLTVANGTVSIEMILRALGIGRGDEVILPPYTFIASISAVIYAGAKPVFADIEPDTFLLSHKAAERAITPRTKAIMPVYVGGRPADLDAFQKLCGERGLYLIGDAAQAVGSRFREKDVCRYGIAASISLQNSKNLNCGEGGLILTEDDGLYERLSRMLAGGRDETGRYALAGLHNGMSEFQASVLNSQLPELDGQIERRMENAAYLDERIAKLGFAYPLKKDERVTRDSRHLYLFGLRSEKFAGVSREKFVEAVNAEGVPLAAGYGPSYDAPCLKSAYTEKCLGSPIDLKPDTPVTERVGRREGVWLYHAVLLGTKRDMDDVIAAMEKVYAHLDELKEVSE